VPYYRLYLIKNDHFAGVDAFEAEDDVQAVRQAGILGGRAAAELWSGKRRVKLFSPESRDSKG
jgi:hypothetical protein